MKSPSSRRVDTDTLGRQIVVCGSPLGEAAMRFTPLSKIDCARARSRAETSRHAAVSLTALRKVGVNSVGLPQEGTTGT